MLFGLENTIHSIVGLARAEKALFTVTRISLGPFLHIDPLFQGYTEEQPKFDQLCCGVQRNLPVNNILGLAILTFMYFTETVAPGVGRQGGGGGGGGGGGLQFF